MNLSNSKIKSTKPGKKIIHLNDGDGLWMEVRLVGSKL
ncbi:MAG: Arm DNA-binding domain-containing protein [Sulfurovum sp.]|nr:Arm DNA-binding domain-containing protein [Sulfurovum sp.]MCB4744661.1 Arm DNA-binding domain-containing protein [Sulfurovum sp.]MCB4766465.1 Arm DNA-binding domain-containing protein [Sulfurovum sp.]MCB4775598.1 Arm DNA-binding domain-containing protein [Sulfurovum sp.]